MLKSSLILWLCTVLYAQTNPKPPPVDSPQIIDRVPTSQYLELNETDPIPKDLLTWDEDSAATLYFSKTELPFVLLQGKLKTNHNLSINDRFVGTNKGTFGIKLSVPLAISTFTVKIFAPDRTFQTFRLLGFWKKVPPSFRIKVEEDSGVVEKSVGFSGRVKRAAFAQLYSESTPTSLVDLDSQKHAQLSFRVYYPPEPEQLYDAWSITIRNSRGQLISETRRYGSPPEHIDWREVSEGILRRDTYFYQVNLFKEAEEYPGIANRFETIEGLSLLRSEYSQNFEVEPRADIGYFTMSHTQKEPPNQISGAFVSADVSFAVWNRWLFRGTALAALERPDPQVNFTFTRLGTGFRLYAHGENSWLGSPHLVRVDLLATLSAFGIPPNAGVPRFIDWGVLVEPHVVLWAYNYFVPWVEYGVRPERGIQRLSVGIAYYFFIRPWSMRMGFAIASDRLLRYQPPGNPEPLENYTFSALRAYTSLVFFL